MGKFTVSVAMLSDWRIGTGTGMHGLVDRSVARDEDGLPYIPAKSLNGIWRDGCEVVASALDNCVPGSWHTWVEFLFGSQPSLVSEPDAATLPPRAAALSLSAARLPADLRAALCERPHLRAALTFLKPGIKVDERTGAAERRMLRIDEIARGGVTLAATVDFSNQEDLSAEQVAYAHALLAAGAALVESVGAGRRRGAGACRMTIGEFGVDLDSLASEDVVAPPPVSLRQEPATEAVAAGSGAWECVRLSIHLRSPVVVAERTVGNAVRSADYVPGRILLPVVLKLLESPVAHAAARTGALVVTDATIAINGSPGRRAPETLLTSKDGGDWLWNTADSHARPDLGAEPVGGYVAEDAAGGILLAAQPRMSQHTHNTIQDTAQRPTEDVGGLYTYNAIATGTVLLADVRVAPGVLSKGWADRLRGDVRLGQSSKDDYGQVHLNATPVDPVAPVAVDSAELSVWVLSDLLVYDEWLRPSTALDDVARVLGDALGVMLTPMRGAVRATQRRIESWHRGWGLPRASLLAVAAGSYLRFAVSGGSVNHDRAAAVEIGGTGLRRAEGFGQVRLNPPLLGSPTPLVHRVAGDTAAGSEEKPELTASSRKTLRVVERAAWQSEIRERSERLAADPNERATILGKGFEKIPRTQLAGLRLAASPLGVDADTWLGSLVTASRKDSWPEAVCSQVRRLLTGPDEIWRLLDRGQGIAPLAALCATAETVPQVQQDLAGFARRTLIDDCLTAHRRSAETGEAS